MLLFCRKRYFLLKNEVFGDFCNVLIISVLILVNKQFDIYHIAKGMLSDCGSIPFAFL